MQDVSLMVGVDVAMDELVVRQSSSRQVIRNRAAEIRKWLRTLPDGAILGMQSTGCHHQLLALTAQAAGFRVYVLNAKDVWYFAKGEGRRGKTDRVDAEVIRNYLRDHIDRLHEWCPGTAVQREVEALLRRRQTLEKHETAIRQSLGDMPSLKESLMSLERATQAAYATIDQRVLELVAGDEEMSRKQALLQTIVGIGPQTSAALVSLLARMQFRNADSLIAYAGLDPRPNDSGKKRGARHLTKRGPSYLRRLAYMCGFSASHSRLFSAAYRALLARGMTTTESFVILGRRLFRIAWSIWRSDTPFDASRLRALAG